MNGVNQVILEGNVVRNVEKRTGKNGISFCNVPIAVSRYYKAGNGKYVMDTSYFNVITYGDIAALCGEEGTKGRGIRIVGRLKQDRYIDREGRSWSKVAVYADYVDFRPRTNPDTASQPALRDEGGEGSSALRGGGTES